MRCTVPKGNMIGSIQELSASATGATAAWNIDVVQGVQVQRDAKGHVTGITVTSGKIPSNPNTDEKVTQTETDSDAAGQIPPQRK